MQLKKALWGYTNAFYTLLDLYIYHGGRALSLLIPMAAILLSFMAVMAAWQLHGAVHTILTVMLLLPALTCCVNSFYSDVGKCLEGDWIRNQIKLIKDLQLEYRITEHRLKDYMKESRDFVEKNRGGKTVKIWMGSPTKVFDGPIGSLSRELAQLESEILAAKKDLFHADPKNKLLQEDIP